MKQLPAWILIKESLLENIPVMLLYVLESNGSSPGRQGFMMAVNKAGEMEGSIGGGIMEHKFVEMAKERLSFSDHTAPSDIRKQVHDKSAAKNQSGMICSGEQTILIFQVQMADIQSVSDLVDSLEKNQDGTLTLSPSGIYFERGPVMEKTLYSFVTDQDWIYSEKMGYSNNLYIIGGGHCSLALSALMRTMDFYIRVFDDRKGLKTLEANKSAQETVYLDSYTQLKDIIPSGDNSYVVIMTFGYRSDDIALRSLLDKRFKYLGVMGSKAKIKKMFAEYHAGGITEKQLEEIHTPIGLPIKSQTPEEIAVSIAAEIIQEKNRLL